MRTSKGCWLATAALIVLTGIPAARAFIDSPNEPVEKYALPWMLRNSWVAVFQVEQVNADRGIVLYKLSDTIEGKRWPQRMKHLVTVEGKVPTGLSGLKAGQAAVCFAWDRLYQLIVTFVEGTWYVAHVDGNDSSWCRIAGVRPDLNCVFVGSASELIDALKELAAGRDVVVRCWKEKRGTETQLVRYSMKEPRRRLPAPIQKPAGAEGRDLDGTVQVGKGRRQLFLDDDLVAEKNGLKRVLHRPQKHTRNPVIVGEHPWEESVEMPSALYEPEQGKIRLWYRSTHRKDELDFQEVDPDPEKRKQQVAKLVGSTVCQIAYAESKDGVRFNKPTLGLIEFRGKKENNLVWGRMGDWANMVVKSPNEQDPAKRYQCLIWAHPDLAATLATSGFTPRTGCAGRWLPNPRPASSITPTTSCMTPFAGSIWPSSSSRRRRAPWDEW